MNNLYMMAVGKVSPDMGIVIVTEQDVKTVAPLEAPSAAYVAARDIEQRRLGVRLWKYFTHDDTANGLSDADIAAELEELRDGMDDDEWHSRGEW